MKRYDHRAITDRWNREWVESNVCRAEDFSEKPKKYILVEFPYPSGTGLHMGHFFRFALPDIYARKLRMAGYNVLFPLGFDAFGLPAENYAIRTGVHPAETTREAVRNFTRSFQEAGFGIDWQRLIDTTDPHYYKWTQWIFLRLFEAGLAELREEPVWWCEELRTVLANEEVLEDEQGNKVSERGGHPVQKRKLRQWVLKITQYAEKLLLGLDEVDFFEYIKIAQRNWIGRSEGARIEFPLQAGPQTYPLEVFTTRPDTLFGVTFMVLAPEHPALAELKAQITNWAEVEAYRNQAANLSDLERQAWKEKTGVRLEGAAAEHPLAPGRMLPVYIADYVMMGYGTGAIMAVPAHDERDHEFAAKFGIPIVQTIYSRPPADDAAEEKELLPFTSEEGFVKLTPEVRALFDGQAFETAHGQVTCAEMKRAVVRALAARKRGRSEVAYRLRDWVFSRQRYWGEPIPLLHCVDGSVEPIARTENADEVRDNLPLLLPDVPDYTPSSDGTSPLAKNKQWVQTNDRLGRPAQRETNTMPNWAGSCWYYIRYCDPANSERFCDPEKMRYWLPVDRYFGGGEHTTRHLLYSRFWHRALYDQGLVPTSEPYAWRINGGILLGADGYKQSKSRGNGVDLNDMLGRYGADALRLCICFLGPYDATMPWNEGGLKACRRLVESIYELRESVSHDPEPERVSRLYHRMVKRVTSMVDELKMNTAVSEFMIFVNELKREPHIQIDTWKGFVRLIAPFTVFLSEELWQEINGYSEWRRENSVHLQPWPGYEERLAKDETIVLGVQVNGKVRAEIEVTPADSSAAVQERAMAIPAVQKWLSGKEVKKFIYVPGRIVSIVT